MKNAEKHNPPRNMLNYNTSTKAILQGAARKAVSGKLARFEIKVPGPTIQKPVGGKRFKLNVLPKI